MPTMGLLRVRFPVEPWKGLLKLNTPPSEATVQYPPVAPSAAMPTIGSLSTVFPTEPL